MGALPQQGAPAVATCANARRTLGGTAVGPRFCFHCSHALRSSELCARLICARGQVLASCGLCGHWTCVCVGGVCRGTHNKLQSVKIPCATFPQLELDPNLWVRPAVKDLDELALPQGKYDLNFLVLQAGSPAGAQKIVAEEGSPLLFRNLRCARMEGAHGAAAGCRHR